MDVKDLIDRIEARRREQPTVYFAVEIFGHWAFIQPKDMQNLERLYNAKLRR